ncbi:globin-coupled sensor protein [Flexibacterium corallicola]|uniref:globin-coupled sensor protein n=1 Tax=Flexibacterium corallicola TaxID=3037259 RepID=UPI00286F9D39|nr:globin-coupled sensor protein [Pseudovibrio sp. M1P-2-3]
MSVGKAENIDEILHYYQIDINVKKEIYALWPTVKSALPKILDDFYDYIEITPKLATAVQGVTDRLKSAQSKHWELLFSGEFGRDYLQNIERIGRAHVQIGLSPDWYVGGYNFILNKITTVIIKKHRWSSSRLTSALVAIQKVILLDAAFAVGAYEAVFLEEREQRIRNREEAISNFEDRILKCLQNSHALNGSLETNTTSLKSASQNNKTSAQSANKSAEETALNVQSGAASVEQMSVSVAEIGVQIHRSADTVKQVSKDAEKANSTVINLQEAANEIGAVTELISAIAEQTNLLALNATIEAARAGDAGKGFAVVATEVKELASQTGKATDEIASKITAIQQETEKCVREISSIGSKIADVSENASSIAGAIEEQEAATNEISNSIQSASQNASGTTFEIAEILRHTQSANNAVDATVCDTEKLIEQMKVIQKEIEQFFNLIRAA